MRRVGPLLSPCLTARSSFRCSFGPRLDSTSESHPLFSKQAEQNPAIPQIPRISSGCRQFPSFNQFPSDQELIYSIPQMLSPSGAPSAFPSASPHRSRPFSDVSGLSHSPIVSSTSAMPGISMDRISTSDLSNWPLTKEAPMPSAAMHCACGMVKAFQEIRRKPRNILNWLLIKDISLVNICMDCASTEARALRPI